MILIFNLTNLSRLGLAYSFGQKDVEKPILTEVTVDDAVMKGDNLLIRFTISSSNLYRERPVDGCRQKEEIPTKRSQDFEVSLLHQQEMSEGAEGGHQETETRDK